jgi:acyl-coenzyme A synthetase/AMP-(fatty) acid ligase
MRFCLSAADLLGRGEAPALISKAGAVSYRDVAARAVEIAEALHTLGVFPGEPVAIVSAARAHDEPAALLGILLYGATAVPLDSSSPPARLAAIAAARGARFVVHDEGAEKLALAMGPLGRIRLGADGGILATSAGERKTPGALDPSLACILHTSGSTGTPKAVPITWEGLDVFTQWTIDLVGLSAEDRVLRVAELIFDLAWFDHIATFRAGAALCTMARRDLANGRALADAIDALAPTVIYGVPSMFMKLSAALGTERKLARPPKNVFFAGEVFPPRELASFAAKLPDARFFNFYGPTETNVCTFHEVDRATLPDERETPIGRACPYAVCKIVAEDDGSRILEGPGIGELVVAGPTTVGGGPYATGDRVERKEDGLLYFRGRIDRMVKVRGYRVEPGEVEATLDTHPAVRQSAVLPHDDPRLGRTLRAFVALREQTDERSLRAFLAERLPPYMVPERITTLEELPRTPTGKIDYRALQSS